MQKDCWYISTIFVNYIQGKPYYVYLSNVASGLDAYSSSYIVGDISPTTLIWNFNYCRKVLSKTNILINIKTKKCSPKCVLHWEFASVYVLLNKEADKISFVSITPQLGPYIIGYVCKPRFSANINKNSKSLIYSKLYNDLPLDIYIDASKYKYGHAPRQTNIADSI